MNRITLGAFLTLVPAYSETMAVAVWLETWPAVATPEGWVILVDSLGCPQALLNGWSIAAQVYQDPNLQTLPLGNQTFQAGALPFSSIRADLSLTDWLAAHPHRVENATKQEHPTVLVSLDGQYLGLLDLAALTHHLAHQVNYTTPGLGEDIAPELLGAWDALQWPVLIQTGEGEALWQNSAWKTHLGNDQITIATTGQMQGYLLCGGQRQTSRWQFYSLPLSTDHRVLATAQVLKNQPELLPALCLTGLGVSLAHALPPNPLTPVTLWIVIGVELVDADAQIGPLAANLTALRQRYQQQQDFLASLNHDLKNPITSILSLTQLLQQSTLSAPQARHQTYLEEIERASRQLSYILTQWLELSQAQHGNLELAWEPLHLPRIIDQAKTWITHHPELFRPDFSPVQLAHHLHHLHVSIDPGLEMISADRLRLRQIVGHLLIALLWLAQNHPDLSGAWGITAKPGQGWHELEVWQTGVGLGLAEQITLLETLGDGGDITTPLGLGLILARHLIRLHGGELSLWATETQDNGRVEFRMLWPANLNHGGRIILLYGHGPAWLRQMQESLQAWGYITAMARQDLELLDKSQQLQPQAIILEPALYQARGEQLYLASLRHLLAATPETTPIPLLTWSHTTQNDPHLRLYVLQENLDPAATYPALQALLAQLETAPTLPYLAPVATPAPPAAEPTTVLTVLRLGATRAFTPQLHRFLEADDVEQGQLLADIWQPDILLWDLPLPLGLTELNTLPQYPLLARLPLVTLDEQITRQAYQIPGVVVYPCLDVALLGQVIERAWRDSRI